MIIRICLDLLSNFSVQLNIYMRFESLWNTCGILWFLIHVRKTSIIFVHVHALIEQTNMFECWWISMIGYWSLGEITWTCDIYLICIKFIWFKVVLLLNSLGCIFWSIWCILNLSECNYWTKKCLIMIRWTKYIIWYIC